MFTDEQFLAYCLKLGFLKQTQEVIQEIRSSPPSRRPESSRGRGIVKYTSRKMGRTIMAEADKIRLPPIYMMEHNWRVPEYWDFPPPIKFNYKKIDGDETGLWYKPRFFTLTLDGAGWEDWRSEKDLRNVSEESPNLYIKEGDKWRCPPGEEYAKQFGLYYQIHSNEEINWFLARNLIFLEDYFRVDCPPVKQKAVEEVLKLVTSEPGIRLNELIERVKEAADTDDIYKMIVDEQIYVDLLKAPIPEADQVLVFRNDMIARAYITVPSFQDTEISTVNIELGQAVHWDGKIWTISNVGAQMIWLQPPGDSGLISFTHADFEKMVANGVIKGLNEKVEVGTTQEGKEILRRARPEDREMADKRLRILEKIDWGLELDKDEIYSDRTYREWRARRRDAEERYRDGYIGLLPHFQNCGNWTSPLPEGTVSMVNNFISTEYENRKGKSIHLVWGQYVNKCEEQNITSVSYPTFAAYVNKRPRHEQLSKRVGSRDAYDLEPEYWELEFSTPKHGERPWQHVHLDHTPFPVPLISSGFDHLVLGTAYGTFLTDAFTRKLYFVFATFDPPSYRTDLLVMRGCVRKFNRLPQVLITDNGSDFYHKDFERAMARRGCTLRKRPKGKPRHGSEAERLFGTTTTEFIQNLNDQWTLSRFYNRLCEWAYKVYNQTSHPAWGMSPDVAYDLAMKQFGQRPHILIPYDESFILSMLPSTSKGTAKVQPGRGVKINYIYYRCNDFFKGGVENSVVRVRYDPWDIGIAYAYIERKGWVRCESEYYARFQGRSEREIMIASQELRKRRQNHAQKFEITAKLLADFITSLEAEEALYAQRLHDAEIRPILAEMGVVSPLSYTAQSVLVSKSTENWTNGVGMIDQGAYTDLDAGEVISESDDFYFEEYEV